MNTIGKIFFWIFTIALGFVNPVISFGLIVLYYLPGIVRSIYNECNKTKCNEYETENEFTTKQSTNSMKEFSIDTLEDMR